MVALEPSTKGTVAVIPPPENKTGPTVLALTIAATETIIIVAPPPIQKKAINFMGSTGELHDVGTLVREKGTNMKQGLQHFITGTSRKQSCHNSTAHSRKCSSKGVTRKR
jgi:hypothetical protein